MQPITQNSYKEQFEQILIDLKIKEKIWLKSSQVVQILGISKSTLQKFVNDRAIAVIRSNALSKNSPFLFAKKEIQAYFINTQMNADLRNF